MDAESDEAWLARQVEGLARSEMQNLARGLAWTAWWLEQAAECRWVLPGKLLSTDPFENAGPEWPDPPGNPHSRN